MAVTLNAKGTSVPYFKIGKSGSTLFQGGDDPHVTSGYSVKENDIWFDTDVRTLRFRTAAQSWQALAEADKISEMTDVDLTGLADGNFLRYDGSSNSWTAYAVTGGLSNDWGSIIENGITVDGYTGDIWQFEAQTGMLSHTGPVTVNGPLVAQNIVSDSIPSDVNELSDADGLLNHVSNTDSLIEGGTNLFYTDTRVEAHLDSGTSTPTLASATITSELTADTIVATTVTGNTVGTHTGNVIGSLNGNVTGRLYGDVHGDVTSPTSLEPIITTGPVRDTLTIHDAHIDKIKAPGTNGATILNTSGATTLSGHNVHLTGSLYGDIGDTLANNPVLTVGTGNNDSQLAVTVASIDELTVNDSFVLPKGADAQRPSTPAEGMMWFNTTTKKFEGYDGTNWIVFSPENWGSIA